MSNEDQNLEIIGELKRRGISIPQEYSHLERKYNNQYKGFSGVAHDIGKSFSNILPSIMDFITSVPGEIKGAVSNSSRIPQNIAAGVSMGGHGLLSTPGNIRDYLAEKELISQKTPSFRLPENILPKEYNYAKSVGLNDVKPGDALIQALSAGAPYAAVGELGMLGQIPRMAARAASQAAFSIGQNQDPLLAAMLGPAIELPIRGAIHGLNKSRPSQLFGGALAPENLDPSKVFRGRLTPEQLQANLEAARGTNTQLGRIVESPTLSKAFENVTSNIPFSGAEDLLGRMATQVEERGESLFGQLGKGRYPEDVNESIHQTIQSAHKSQQKIKNELYSPLKSFDRLEMPRFSRRAEELTSMINDSPLLQNEPKFRSAYNRIVKFKNPVKELESKLVDASGKPLIHKTIYPSISDAKLVLTNLEDQGNKFLNSPLASERYIGSKFLELANLARQDIKESVEKFGLPHEKEQFKLAEKNYIEKYSPFLDKSIYKFTRENTNTEKLARDIIKVGQGDRYKDIEKIQKLLPENKKTALGYSYLKEAFDKEGQLDPKKLATLVNKLGPRQFKALFPEEKLRNDILKYGRLRGMNEEALSMMANPKTGARNLKVLTGVSAALGGLVGVTNPLVAAIIGGLVIGGSRKFNKYVTNEATREKFVAKMLGKDQSSKTVKNLSNKVGKALQRPLYMQSLPDFKTENYDIYLGDEDRE